MIKIEKETVFGFEAAVRGARNPMNSWAKSDSKFVSPAGCVGCENEFDELCDNQTEFKLGENDLKLLVNLSLAGTDEGKFMRMIHVQVDVTAPLYWWKEADTYKVGTVANSSSTMHKIHSKEFTLDDFSHDHSMTLTKDLLYQIIKVLNSSREGYLLTKDKMFWWQMIQLLPSSYNQKRTLDLNYAVLKNMYHARKNHKLDEWREFCRWIENLPYAKELIVDAVKKPQSIEEKLADVQKELLKNESLYNAFFRSIFSAIDDYGNLDAETLSNRILHRIIGDD